MTCLSVIVFQVIGGFLPIYRMKYCMQVNIGWEVKKEKQTFFLADIFVCFSYTLCMQVRVSVVYLLNFFMLFEWNKLGHKII